MGRCRSTPGLVESSGKIKLEDMVVGPTTSGATCRIFEDASLTGGGGSDSSGNGIPMEPLYLDRRRTSAPGNPRQPQLPTFPQVMQPTTSFLSLHSGSTNTRPVSPYQQAQLESSFVPELTQQDLLLEIKRLRERVLTLESDNATMSLKLTQSKWEMQHRLADLELHICSPLVAVPPPSNGSNHSSSGDERNRESII